MVITPFHLVFIKQTLSVGPKGLGNDCLLNISFSFVLFHRISPGKKKEGLTKPLNDAPQTDIFFCLSVSLSRLVVVPNCRFIFVFSFLLFTNLFLPLFQLLLNVQSNYSALTKGTDSKHYVHTAVQQLCCTFEVGL